MAEKTYSARVIESIYSVIRLYCVRNSIPVQEFIQNILKKEIESNPELKKYKNL
jgi:hypothetical protein